MDENAKQLIEVRSTINFSGLRSGDLVLVDESDPSIAELIRATILVPTAIAHANPGSHATAEE